METKVQGMQGGKATITPNCRSIHGDEKAVDIALKEIKEKYLFMNNAEANKNATYRIVVTVDR